ncbi:MAG TPA: 3-oxoadipate enol-lactonase [Pseudonocardiaceae bacterium]|jgi:3-oxoadipate enol-lactonase|nr:3-oxoadipate enol-lactonase [Pseudonocardiaceae bacterium]
MTSLAYDLAGPSDAPVLVLGPSLGTTRAMWNPQHAVLCRQFRVLRFDLLGHGGSAVLPGPYTVDQLAGEVLSLLRGIEHFHYVGLSLGGMIGMALAASAPDRIDRLALLCTSAHLPPADAWLERAEHVRAHGTGSIADTVGPRWFTPAFTDRAPYLAMLAATPDEGYAACCAAIAAMDLRSVLGRITAPTLVIAGHDDPATPPAHGRRIAYAIRGARFVELDDAAHLASVERPAEVTALLTEHLGGAR